MNGIPGRAPRILFLVNDPAFFASHRLPLAIAALDQGMDVLVVAPDGTGLSTIKQCGISVRPISNPRDGAKITAFVRLLRSADAAMTAFKPDVVHLITSMPVIAGGIVACLHRTPVVAAISGLGHIFTHTTLKHRILRKIVAVAYRLALDRPGTVVIFQNGTDRGFFVGNVLGAHVETDLIEGSGVDLARFRHSPEPLGVPVAVLPARLLADKGIREFVEAAKLLRGQGVQARFVLQGDPDPRNPTTVTERELRDWVSAGVVEWHRHSDDMPSVLAAANLVVLPSYREGLPKSLIEAAAAGRAIVTTDVPGCRDAIEAGVTGLLCESRDGASLAGAMRELLVDEQRRHAMGQAGRARAEARFDLADVVQRHLQIYRALARNPRGGRP